MKYANAKSVDILAIQEHHLHTDSQRARAENIFATRGYTLLAPLAPEGRGGGGSYSMGPPLDPHQLFFPGAPNPHHHLL